MTYPWYLSGALLLGGIPSLAAAHCERVTDTHQLSEAAISAGYNARSWAGANNAEAKGRLGLPGNITLSGNKDVQRQGTLLGSASSSFISSGRTGGYNPNQVLFKCDSSQQGEIYEFFATNGMDEHSGRHPVAELDGAYYTRVKNVALRLTNQKSGQHYLRQWQKRAITAEEIFNDGQHIYIPASAFSDVFVELLRVDNSDYGVEGSARDSYQSDIPSGYVAFQGGGIGQGLSEGADSASSSDGRPLTWPAGWSLANQTLFLRYSACQITDYPSTVLLPTTTVDKLKSGGASQSPFSVTLSCSTSISVDRAQPPILPNTTMRFGLVVINANAATQASNFSLTNGTGYTWLLDNNYGASGVASGVGVRIFNSKLGTDQIDLAASTTVSSTDNGWYPLTTIADLTDTSDTDIYTANFTASLERFAQDVDVTPGSVYAQAQIVVALP